MTRSTPDAPDARGVRRLSVIAAPLLAGAFVLASCGGGESAATRTTIDLNASSTAFVVRPPATTEPPTDAAVPTGDEVVEGTQEYTVQSGDAPYVLTARFGITLEALLAVNEWATVGEFPFPGTSILLPPGAKSVEAWLAGRGGDASASDASASAAPAPSGDAAPTGNTIPDAGDNCAPGKYTIKDTDTSRAKVAKAFDVTVEALDAANANTPGYSSFYPGLEIVIPAKADC